MKDPKQSSQFKRIIKTLDKEAKTVDMELIHYTNHNINEFLTDEQHELLRKE